VASLVGNFEHTLDGKGRLVLPAKLRHHFGETLYVAPGAGCLQLFNPDVFDDLVARLTEAVREGEISQMAWRAFAANSEEVRPDAQGRILLPTQLRELAGLDREVVLSGAVDRVEIWAADRWQEMQPAMTTDMTEVLGGRFGV